MKIESSAIWPEMYVGMDDYIIFYFHLRFSPWLHLQPYRIVDLGY